MPCLLEAAALFDGKSVRRQYGLHNVSVCPHCGAHVRRDVPTWLILLAFAVGWLALFVLAEYLNLSEITQLLLALVWVVCVVAWLSTRPMIVIPNERD